MRGVQVLQVLMVQHDWRLAAHIGSSDAAVAVGSRPFEPVVRHIHVTLVVGAPDMLIEHIVGACGSNMAENGMAQSDCSTGLDKVYIKEGLYHRSATSEANRYLGP